VPYQILLGVGRFDPARANTHGRAGGNACADPTCDRDHPGHDHSSVFGTWSYTTDEPLALDALRESMRRLPGSIYRAKGVVHSADAPERRAVLQVVGRRVDISLEEEWGDRAPRTQIVAIGAVGTVDPNVLEASVTSCLSAPPAAGEQ
jgi:G3E family GTPase